MTLELPQPWGGRVGGQRWEGGSWAGRGCQEEKSQLLRIHPGRVARGGRALEPGPQVPMLYSLTGLHFKGEMMEHFNTVTTDH